MEQLDIRKSCGPDDITSGLLKECASSISTLFGTLFRQTTWWWFFQTYGRWQTWFQSSSLTNKKNTENFRGKSLFCVISKVLHVFSLFFGQKLYHLQDGFVKGSSCVTSLLGLRMTLPKHYMRRNSKYFWTIVKHLILWHLTVF